MTPLKVFVIAVAFGSMACNKPTSPSSSKAVSDCLTGKLVKRGICGQYVIELQSANAQGLEIAESWYDPSSAISYKNVFTVANACDFPSAIKQGEIFTFTLADKGLNTCSLCEAYTPTPSARNLISVPCKTN